MYGVAQEQVAALVCDLAEQLLPALTETILHSCMKLEMYTEQQLYEVRAC